MRVAFLGLGNMGRGMARNLLKAGNEVVVYNRTRAKADELAKEGARVADYPAATKPTWRSPWWPTMLPWNKLRLVRRA